MSLISTSYSPTIHSVDGSRQTHEALSTGTRVNHASDDPAALAIATEMLSRIQGNDQGSRNINDGISLAQVADASLEGGTELIQRMRELATQATNGIYNDDNRAALQQEFGQLQEQFSDLASNSQFNGISLLNQNGTIDIQSGSGEGDTIGIETTDLNAQLNGINFFSLDLSTQAGASAALGALDESLQLVDEARTQFGSTQNRLEARLRSVEVQNLNTAEARSRISDTDYAQATADRARQQILESAGIAMQSHSNASRQDALQLLGGL